MHFTLEWADCFDLLYEEGEENPKLMSIGLHDRLIGRPGRAVGLIRFLDYVHRFDRVWFCRGIDIAHHWQKYHPYLISTASVTDNISVRVEPG